MIRRGPHLFLSSFVWSPEPEWSNIFPQKPTIAIGFSEERKCWRCGESHIYESWRRRRTKWERRWYRIGESENVVIIASGEKEVGRRQNQQFQSRIGWHGRRPVDV
jgi:hypothetical protein